MISRTRNGKFVPYGVYDIGANDGYVSLGIDHDTGQFAVNSVRLWRVRFNLVGSNLAIRQSREFDLWRR